MPIANAPVRLDRLSALIAGLAPRVRIAHAGALCDAGHFAAQPPERLHVHLIVRGVAGLCCGAQCESVAAPAVAVCRSDLTHALVPRSDDLQVVCAQVNFDGPAGPLLLSTFDAPLCLSLGAAESDLQHVVALIALELAQPRCAQAALLGHAGEILLIGLLRHLVAQRALPCGVLRGLGDAGLARTLVALHEAPAAAWTLERMAETAGMSRTAFATRFRATMGVTPRRYLNAYRLTIARREVDAGHGLKRAARSAGYESAAALSRALSRQAEAAAA